MNVQDLKLLVFVVVEALFIVLLLEKVKSRCHLSVFSLLEEQHSNIIALPHLSTEILSGKGVKQHPPIVQNASEIDQGNR